MRLEYESDYTDETPANLNQGTSEQTSMSLKKQFVSESKISLSGNQALKKKDLFHLRKLITKHKVDILSKNFIHKVRQNNTHRQPPDINFMGTSEQLNPYESIMKDLESTEGLVLGNISLTIWSFVNIIQITIMVFIFSIMLTFSETEDEPLFLHFRTVSFIIYIFDMGLNFATQRFENGKKLVNLRQIGEFYISNGFFIDLISIIAFPVYLMIESNATIVISLVALIKLWNNIKKFEKFEYLYIKSSEKEHYYGLVKVFITNFVIGHFLSICLNLMAHYNPEKGWHDTIKIQSEDWFTKYVWGYYWGTNIMLTVGFGDLHATSQFEAIILIFIETFSCITLAYNISTVGSLMSELKSRGEQKKKQLKTFHRMSEDNQISSELTTRISNFIEESFQIRQAFGFEEEDAVIQSLPKGIQSEFRIEANRILFDNIGFLNNMSTKTLVNLAEKIERKISHPEEIIKKRGSPSNFTIISNGTIGLCCRRQYSLLNGRVIEKLSVEKRQKPKLISLDFIKAKNCEYDIKSLGYSIVYFLERDKLMECLKDFELDYQFFCTMRDRDEYLLGESEIYPCSICKDQFHDKFKCDRLHFVPLKQHVIHKKHLKKRKCERRAIIRPGTFLQGQKALRSYRQNQVDYEKFLDDHFGKEYIDRLLVSRNNFLHTSMLKSVEMQRGRRMGLFNMQKQQEQKKEEIMAQNVVRDVIAARFNSEIQNNYEKLEKLLLRDQNEYKDFWDLETDTAMNWKYYFTTYNSDNLGQGSSIKTITSFKFLI